MTECCCEARTSSPEGRNRSQGATGERYNAKRWRELAHGASLQNPGQEVKKERLCQTSRTGTKGRFVGCEEGTCVLQESQPDRGLVTGAPFEAEELQSDGSKGGSALTIGVGDVPKRLQVPGRVVSDATLKSAQPIKLPFLTHRRSGIM